VVITKQVQINSQIDGDAIKIIGIMASAIPASTARSMSICRMPAALD
jgi:hypothetical protein